MTTIKLDTNAIRFLMEQDPEFKLELQKAVIQNIVADVRKSFVSEDLQEEIKKIVRAEHEEYIKTVLDDENLRKEIKSTISNMTESVRNGGYSYTKTRVLSADTKALIKSMTKGLIKEQVDTVLSKDAISKFIESFKTDIKTGFEFKIKYNIDQLADAWKEETVHQIQSDVAKHINEAFKKTVVA